MVMITIFTNETFFYQQVLRLSENNYNIYSMQLGTFDLHRPIYIQVAILVQET